MRPLWLPARSENGHDTPCPLAPREEEVTSAVIDGATSGIFDEAENPFHAQKAIKPWCLSVQKSLFLGSPHFRVKRRRQNVARLVQNVIGLTDNPWIWVPGNVYVLSGVIERRKKMSHTA